MASKRFLVEFIDMLKKEPAIWQLEHDNYKDNRERQRSWERLLKKWQEVDKYATIDLVKNKYRIMRACLRREWRKKRKSEESGYTYVPMLWYFDHLKFVITQEALPEGLSSTSVVFDEEEKPCNDEDQTHGECLTDFSFYEENEPSAERINHTERKHIKYEERKYEERKYEERKYEERKTNERKLEEGKPDPLFFEGDIDLPQYTHKRVNRDEADIYSEAWAVTFRKLSEEQRIWAKRLIDDTLMYGQLRQLSAVSSINLGEFQ